MARVCRQIRMAQKTTGILRGYVFRGKIGVATAFNGKVTKK